MLRKILMPKLGLTMTEGVVSEWMVAVGSPVKHEEGLFVVETDKVATEVPAEGDGVLAEIVVQAGETIAVGEVVGYWNDAAEEPMPERALADASAGSAITGAAPLAASKPSTVPSTEAASLTAAPAAAGSRLLSTPLARRLAEQGGVDLHQVQGRGPRCVIKARDVRAAQAVQATQAAQAAQQRAGTAPSAGKTVPREGPDIGVRSKPNSVQLAMARRLTAAKQEVPHFYLAVEAEVGRLLALRAELNAMESGVRFTLNHFIVAAVGRALQDLPQANRIWADGEIVSFTSTDVGVAVNTERGLFVPMVRDAGRQPLAATARQTQEKVEAARTGTLQPDDMSGGAITVSNAGMFNVKFMTPIINPGQAMILGVGSVSEVFRPDAEGKPLLRKEMGLVLAGDHRLLDGVAGLTFLNRVTTYLEQPMKLLISA